MTQLRIALLGMLLLAAVSGPKAQAQVAVQDSSALVALYTAASGVSWTDNTNWLTTPVQRWNRVGRDNNRVTTLDLSRNELTGPLPPELDTLTNLTRLDLSINDLAGAIPPALGNLTKLTTFGFTNTALCEPADPAFQAWLLGIDDARSPGLACGLSAVAEQDSLALVAIYTATATEEPNAPRPTSRWKPTTPTRSPPPRRSASAAPMRASGSPEK